MYRQPLVVVSVIVGLKLVSKIGGLKEITSFNLPNHIDVVGSIIATLIVIATFAELYIHLDSRDDGEEHFSFGSPLDAYYFSTITSSSVGYGDVLPKSNKAKILNMVHVLTMFFLIIPVLSRALEPGN